jgi:hypothetical protein
MSITWQTCVQKAASDFSIVNNMWWWEDFVQPQDPVSKLDHPDIPQFVKKVSDNEAKIMLAVTAPRGVQKAAWKGLIAAGFKPLATGLRAPGHSGGKYVYLWGKRTDEKLHKVKVNEQANLYCCGARLHMFRKFDTLESGRLTLIRVTTRRKFEITKDLQLIAKTSSASYYIKNFAKFIGSL